MKLMSCVEMEHVNAYFNEIRMLKMLNSDYIIKYFDEFRHETFNLCIITENCHVSV